MKKALTILLICNNQTIIDTFAVKIPAKLDSKLWGADVGYKHIQGIDENSSNKFLLARVRFNTEADRTASKNWLENKAQEAGIKPELIVGSYIGEHDCPHDVNGSCPPDTIVWSK